MKCELLSTCNTSILLFVMVIVAISVDVIVTIFIRVICLLFENRS